MDVVKEKKPPVWFTKLRLFLVIVAVAIGWYVFANKSSSMLEIKRTDILVAKVQHGQLDVVIDGYGTLKSNKQQLITALTRATVKNIFIKPGNIVRKGNVIVELDNPELSQLAENASQQLAQERANLRKLKLNQQRELLTEQANIADLTAQLESATLYRVAQQSLLSDGTVSALTFKESQLKEQQLTKRIALMKQRLAQLADVHLEAENIQQQQIMRQQGQVDIALSRLARLQVKADFDGVLQRVPVELGQSLSPGQEVALVGSVTDLVALIRVPQLQAQQVFEEAGQCLLRVKHSGIARLTVTRGSGPRGYAPSRSATPRYILAASAHPDHKSAPWRCGIATTKWQDQPQLAGLKLLARTEQVLAAQEAAAQGWDDVLMLDDQERVISSSRGNILLLKGQTILTPLLDRSGIEGTRRQLLVGSVLPKLGYQVDVRPVTIPDVLTADALMICNTVVGAVAVKSVNQHVYLGYENSFCSIKDELGEHIS